jgi:CDP-diacylglycerol---glycerol-3-phosphate 3-phosphatidyltransferase
MVPVFVVLMSFDNVYCFAGAYLVFIAATVTDYYDGKIARGRGMVSNFGKLLDPVADKVLIAAAFVMLMGLQDLWIPGWTVIAILAREFLITGARSLAASEGLVIAANRWGKTKTVLQMAFIYTFLFLAIVARALDHWTGYSILCYQQFLWYASLAMSVVVALFTVYSGLQYARSNWRMLELGRL